MYHSIQIGGMNTWDDWFLVSEERPSFKPPTRKTRIVDVPGMSGQIDMSNYPLGYPLYGNRKGSLNFIVVNDGYYEGLNNNKKWFNLLSEIENYLGGKTVKATLEDEPDYYYEGKFDVTDFKSGNNHSTITISYDLQPYKWYYITTTGEWEWNPFNFENGVIRSSIFSNIVCSSRSSWLTKTFKPVDFDLAPTYPTFKVVSSDGLGIEVNMVNPSTEENITRTFMDGDTVAPDFVFWGSSNITMRFKGNGTISIDMKTGRL